MFSKDEDEVNDLFQEILIRLWQGFDSFDGKSDMLWVMALLIATYLVAVLITVRKYKKLMSSCDSLIDSLERL